jgi:hypothetical protein
LHAEDDWPEQQAGSWLPESAAKATPANTTPISTTVATVIISTFSLLLIFLLHRVFRKAIIGKKCVEVMERCWLICEVMKNSTLVMNIRDYLVIV